MPGLTFSNELISRDEGMHANYSAMLFKRYNGGERGSIDKSEAFKVVRECVDTEKKFVRESLRVSLIGMNASLMEDYIEYIADYWLGVCGFSKLYGTKNPFPWMEMISLSGKTNFFEKRVAEYQKSGVMNTAEEQTFAMDVAF